MPSINNPHGSIEKADISQTFAAPEYPRFASRVYWHFTGSPENCDWSKYLSPGQMQEDHVRPKTPQICVEIANQILGSNRLIAKCTEFEKGAKFCSVTDIPVKDLPFHSTFYGKVAIGFSAESVQQRFSPVMYIGDDSHFSSLLAKLETHGLDLKQDKLQKILGAETTKNITTVAECANLGHKLGGGLGLLLGIAVGFEQIDKASATVTKIYPEEPTLTAEEALLAMLSYCKRTSFSPDPLGTFYLEREWRCIGDFTFAPGDVESVICPAAYLKELSAKCSELECNASIIAWETLERI